MNFRFKETNRIKREAEKKKKKKERKEKKKYEEEIIKHEKKKKKKYIYYCKGKYSRREIFLRGNIPAGKYSCGFGDFFLNSRVFPHKNISLPQWIFAKVSQLIKNLRNICASIECQVEQSIIYQVNTIKNYHTAQ